jgi:hypothetical protein
VDGPGFQVDIAAVDEAARGISGSVHEAFGAFPPEQVAGTRNARTPEIRQSIVGGRINYLEREINTELLGGHGS